MPVLLVLGAKPEPALPPTDAFDEVACPNAAGFSARQNGLPDAAFTVVTAVLASGKESDEHSLRAMAGLRTGTVYFLARPTGNRGPLRRLHHHLKTWRMKPFNMKRRLAGIGFAYDAFVTLSNERFHGIVHDLCGHDPDIEALMKEKQPSTGTVTLAIALSLDRYERIILSGFDFSLTHAHGHNPLIEQRGSAASKHADTDVAIMACLSQRSGRVVTTERAVHERAGVPMLVPGPSASGLEAETRTVSA